VKPVRCGRPADRQSCRLEGAELPRRPTDAQAAADQLRSNLLYATGRRLVLAIKRVLERRTNLGVEDLDETMGKGTSGDLLASDDRGFDHGSVSLVTG